MKTNLTRKLFLVAIFALSACRTTCRTTAASNPVAIEGPTAINQPPQDLVGDKKLASPE